MDGASRHFRFRTARSPGVALLALIVVLGVGGFLLTSTTIHHDQDAAAERRAQVEAVHAQEVLGRARAYVAGLAEVLSREPKPGQARFARWASATSASVGLNDVLWVQRVLSPQRARYERLQGFPITRLTASGDLTRAPAAPSYLPATFTSQTRPELRPGVDVTTFPALADAIGDRARIFAVGASRPGALGPESGFYLLEAATFARGADSSGYLVAFVPRGWFSTTLGGDPRRVAISQDGRRIEGQLGSVHASASFETLGRDWRIDVGREPPSGLQSLLPWLALAWPFAVAAVGLAIGRAVMLRRRAQLEVERIFALSLDMISVFGFDGRFMAVNPAFERTLGYPQDAMLGRPFSDFVHPDDLDASREAFDAVLSGDEVTQFENRYVCADGSERWLQWSSRAMPEERAVYCIARDVTERRLIDAELREAQLTAEARGAELEVRAAEEAARRRVATLVARQASQAEVVSAIADETGRLLGTEVFRVLRYEHDRTAVVLATAGAGGEFFPVGSRHRLGGTNTVSRVFETRRAVRIDDYGGASGPIGEAVRAIGLRSVVAAPILVGGRLWGAMLTGTMREEPVPPETESRLRQFTDLMATAIANTESRAEVERLADEQSALRGVATVVAGEVSEAEVFTAVAEEIGRLLGVDEIRMLRYEAGKSAFVVAGSGERTDLFPVGLRIALGGENAATRVFRTGHPARVDDYGRASGPIAQAVLASGLRSVVAAPIVVEGRRWGAIAVGNIGDEPLPPETESRLAQFTDLMATAVANAESRARADRLADEQAALRRVATLVAERASSTAVFDAVAAEMQALLDADQVALNRFERGDEMLVLAHRGLDVARTPVGSRVSTEGASVTAMVRRTGRPARMEDYDGAEGALADIARATGLRSSVSAPIMVEGRLWGLITASWKRRYSPSADTEERMTKFSELVGTAMANAEARAEVERLAEEQAALRRVATLVAQGASPTAVLDGVAAEMEALLDADAVTLSRYEVGDEVTVVAHQGKGAHRVPPGTRIRSEAASVTATVRRTQRSTRVEGYGQLEGPSAQRLHAMGLRAAVGAPIVVDGRLWGVAIANWQGEQSPPAGTEARMAQFAELLDTAIANADARGQLNASRARLVTAGDEARRRVVRDLHDGAQQRLVHTIVTLKLAQRALVQEDASAVSLIDEALKHAERGNEELRELAHGILPSVLTRGGLEAGVDSLAARLPVPVDVDVPPDRFAEEIEASAYFVVAEALTNVVKHARAEHAQVRASVTDATLTVEVRDDGVGGADATGHGLVGITDRVSGLGGRLEIHSPANAGTILVATLPLTAR